MIEDVFFCYECEKATTGPVGSVKNCCGEVVIRTGTLERKEETSEDQEHDG